MDTQASNNQNRPPYWWLLWLGICCLLLSWGGGYIWGHFAVLPFAIVNHMVHATWIAGILHVLLRLAPNGYVWVAIGSGLVVSIGVLTMGHLEAYQYYYESYIQNHIHTSVLDTVFQHLKQQGIEAGFIWLLQALTLPVILCIGAVSGAYFAFEKAEGPEPGPLDQIIEIEEQKQEEIRKENERVKFGPIRPINIRQLAVDFFHSYTSFIKPVVLTMAVVWLFPSHDAKPVLVFIASLSMLQAANDILTGTSTSFSLGLRATFQQFMIYVRLAVYLFIVGSAGVLVTIFLMAILNIERSETNEGWLAYPAAIACLILMDRLWPMLVIHYLFQDVDENSSIMSQQAGDQLRNDFWFGSPGSSTLSAWKLTGSQGSFMRGTVPALLIPICLTVPFFELISRLDGLPGFLTELILVLAILPCAYLVLMDRTLALRDIDIEGDISWYTDDKVFKDAEENTVVTKNQQDEEFISRIPPALLGSEEERAAYAEQQLDLKIHQQNTGNPQGLLFDAIRYNNMTWFNEALVNGADIRARDSGGKTTLARACKSNRPEIVRHLLNSGVPPDIGSDDSSTPIPEAVSHDSYLTVLKLLLDAGADVNPPGLWYRTPLMIAAENNALEIAKTLIEAGANLSAQNDARTPIELATIRGHSEMFSLLAARSGDEKDNKLDEKILVQVLRSNHEQILDLLVEHGLDVNAPISSGQTLLMVAAGEGYPGMIRKLLVLGADPGVKDKAGRLASAYAFDWDGKNRQSFDLCEKLLKEAGG